MKKILKRIGIILGILAAILFAVNAYFVYTTDIRLEHQLAAIRAAGEPLSLIDLARIPIPPEKNADTYLRQAEPGVEAICDLLYPDTKDPIVKKLADSVQSAVLKSRGNVEIPLTNADLEAIASHEDKEWEESYGGWNSNSNRLRSPMPQKLQKTLHAIFASHAEVIPLLEKAAACPDYDARLDYTLPPNKFMEIELDQEKIRTSRSLHAVVSKMRSAVHVLSCRSLLYATDGNRDEAIRSALMIFRLARYCSHNPTSYAYLVSATISGIAADCADTALQAGPISNEVHRALEAELALQDCMDAYTWMLKSERAVFMTNFSTAIPGRNIWFIGRPFWNRQESECLDAYDTLLMLTKHSTPLCEAEKMMKRKHLGAASFIARELLNEFQIQYQVALRTPATIRSLRILNALQTHVSAGSNEVPRLTELGLPSEATTDPYTGSMMRVKRVPQGWLVYSLGPNFKDDGGKVEDPMYGDIGVGPPLPATKTNKPGK